MPDSRDSLLTIAGFCSAHPWPERLLAQGKPLEYLWDFPLTVAPEKLWPHLIDTSRLNRALGLAEMTFVEEGGVLRGSSVNGGKAHEWVEEPWAWVAGHSLTAVRVYDRGFSKVARVVYRVLADPTPRLLVYFGFIPRGLVGKLALRVGVPPVRRGYERVLAKLQEQIERPGPEPYVADAPALGESARTRLSKLKSELLTRGVDSATLDRLASLLETGDDLDLYRIQPRRLAHQWEIDEETVLSTCLEATRIGMLALSWDVICPHCRGVRDESVNLSGLVSSGACDVCEIDFSTDFENAVEVTFHIHASIRDVPKRYFCSAEPATKQHIKIQQLIEAGSERTIETSLPPARYRMRLPGERIAGFLTVKEGADEKASQITWSSDTALAEIEAGENPQLLLRNTGESAELFVVEDVRWTDEALRPSMLFSMQKFRDLFSEEYLGSDVKLSVGEQTLMFTDMVGSTRYYQEHGDPAAFVRVKDHFESVFQVISENQGAVVKTIGDAVMAVFSDPLGAVRASGGICNAFPAVASDPDAIRLRVSLNSGPCIAVNLNTGIDYFGGTVNMAAKLQACAEAGEVAIARSVYDAPGVAEHLQKTDADVEIRKRDLGFGEIEYAFWRV